MAITEPRNILIIKPSSIGDVVHTWPIWNLLRRHYAKARISWLVTPACAGIIDGLPNLRLLRFERRGWARAWYSPSAAGDLIRFCRDLRRDHYDLVLDVQGLFRSAWLAFMTGAPVRVGFANAREFAWLFYTHRIPVPTMDQHAVDRYLSLLPAIGCPSAPVEFPFPVADTHRQTVRALLKDIGPFAVLCPGANWETKRWPIERFAELVQPLKDRFGLNCVVTGGPEVAELGNHIPGAVNLCGKTSLMEVAALFEAASVVIANDSGPMHIASALGRPLVSIFGPTNPIRTGPYGRMETVVRANLECMPCYSRTCTQHNHRCLQELGVEPVLATAQRQLELQRA
jgi:heptosyltransferase I